MVDYQKYIDTVDNWIVNKPKVVIGVFLFFTLIFLLGFGGVGTETGTEQFTEEFPSQDAWEQIQDKFEQTSFRSDTQTTQLIQSSQNVLSKKSILRMLRVQKRIRDKEELDISSSSSIAQIIARKLDPNAETLEQQINSVENTPQSRLKTVARRALRENPQTNNLLSDDFNLRSVYATATLSVVEHSLPFEESGAGTGGGSPMAEIQLRIQNIVNSVDGDIIVFGSGIISNEFSNVIMDSLIIVVPAASLLILIFLIVAYRDPIDLILGIISLAMAIIWTFGFMGLAEIPFTQMLIAVPPLLLAVGIDFGIHAINRYREERILQKPISKSMRIATDQLLVAFFIVTFTTVIGFSSNLISALPPIRDFGLIASIGIIFTFLIFGIFLPAAKVYADNVRSNISFPEFGNKPLGSEDSILGKILPIGVKVGEKAPRLFLMFLVLFTGFLGYYGGGVGTSFSQEDFLPPEDVSPVIRNLPEPFKPSEYTSTETINFLEDKFATGETDQVEIYIEGAMRRSGSLETIYRVGNNPPNSFIRGQDGRAQSESILDVINSYASRSSEFESLVESNDLNSNGVPDHNLEKIYNHLLSSPVRNQALNYITSDFRSSRIIYSVENDESQDVVVEDAKDLANKYRFNSVATGQIVIFKDVSDAIFSSAVYSLTIALIITSIFLIIIYRILEGEMGLGIVNIVPIVVTVALIVATMRYFEIPFNALSGTILSISIGLGVDYSAHLTHRFADEYRGDPFEALYPTVRGTGGALTGSMLTTVTGIGVLVFAITPILGQFGILVGLSIFYSYLSSIVVLPPTLVIWHKYKNKTKKILSSF